MRTTAVVAALLLLAGCTAERPASPAQVRVAPDPTAAPPPEAEHHRWMVTEPARIDVDGDGIRERLIVRENLRRGTRPQIAVHFVDGRVEASWCADGSATTG